MQCAKIKLIIFRFLLISRIYVDTQGVRKTTFMRVIEIYFDHALDISYNIQDSDDFYGGDIEDNCNSPSLLHTERECKRCIVMGGHTVLNPACTCIHGDGVLEPSPSCLVSVYEQVLTVRLEHPRWKMLRSLYSIVVSQ